MRPKFAQIARAHGLPKTHKPFEYLPKFRPIINTTNTPYYGISKFLSNLLNPLTENQYVVKDSFAAANKIREISKELFDHGYRFVSFDVESLFTSVPLSETINIILDRIYNKKLLKTNIKKRAMKKLLKDCCTKNAFSFNNTIYEQIDGVSMGSCLVPVLANFQTELETAIVDKLFAANLLKFYIRYVDDTLALIKESGINTVLKKLNSFHLILKFTVDKFDDGIAHYLDIKVVDNETDIYFKDTHAGSIHAFFFICSMAYKNSMGKSIISTSCKNLQH